MTVWSRLGANICVVYTFHCGKRIERDGLHGLSCNKNAGRFSRHATLNSFTKQMLGSPDLPSMLEPRGMFRTDGKPQEGVTKIPLEIGKQLVWDIKVVDALALSRLNQGSSCNPEPLQPRLKCVRKKKREVSRIHRQWIHVSTACLGSTGFIRREQ